MLKRIERCSRDIGLDFDRWGDPYARGPGLYFLVERDSVGGFVTPMGANRWPTADCETVFAETETLLRAALKIAFSCDGAVVFHGDGTIEGPMVRVEQLSPGDSDRIADLPYRGWVGARHMSALETSTCEEVLAAITLSEDG